MSHAGNRLFGYLTFACQLTINMRFELWLFCIEIDELYVLSPGPWEMLPLLFYPWEAMEGSWSRQAPCTCSGASTFVSRGGRSADAGVSSRHSAVHPTSKIGLSPNDQPLGQLPVATAGLVSQACACHLVPSSSVALRY